MKVGSECGYCLMHRGHKIIQRSTNDEKKRVEAMTGLLQMLGERYEPNAVPSFIGAERCRVIKDSTGCDDPYADLKAKSNTLAVEILPQMADYVNKQPEAKRLYAALKVACIGNVIEFDVPGHSADIKEALKGLEEGLYIDDTEKLKKLLKPGKKILILADNAGEIAFDRLVVRELQRIGCIITVAVKAGPSLNDALMEDAEAVGMTEEADNVITTGADSIGINLAETSEEFNTHFYDSDVIIAKGMANWETLTEVPAPCPLMYVLRTKCEPVARTLDAPLNVNIAKLVTKGWKL
ncbi:MAG: ARMT1-like domain-containing protein [Candidatus Bathyarchaeota archaeon]|nr:ARMT1-like domain-containing protein [Candidatus Bathyarchaeota archaeon]